MRISSAILYTAYCIPIPGAISQHGPVILPIEVVGYAEVLVDIPAGSEVRSLWMQIHGLSYAGMASVRVNEGPWVPLSNETVTVARPGRSYGGIGGGFATLKMTLSTDAVRDGSNTLRFRMNQTNGIASGFRVLAFNFLDSRGRPVLASGVFQVEDPDTWIAPLAGNAEGRRLWESASLRANGLPDSLPIRAHCGDCHTRDGRDLKYFNFSNGSIVARARFHGLSELEGKQIASYIRSLPGPNPGRPWNPPYQPGPGLDAQPVANWAAGAGLESVLNDDAQTLPFLLKKANLFRPDDNLNAREIPIAMQLPDWNHWLPRVHPLDFRGVEFNQSRFGQWRFETGTFDKWIKARNKFLRPPPKTWTSDQEEAYYSSQLWQLVKTWELIQENHLEQSRSWANTVAAATAPSEVGIPTGIGSNEYLNNAWYELQLVLNSGEHRHNGIVPIHWPYLLSHFLELQQHSGEAEPGRLLVAVVKSMQSTDPRMGPRHMEEGWRPEQNIDARLMVDERWSQVFLGLPREVRVTIAESMLTAWLEKNEQYPASAYFERGRSAKYYKPSKDLQGIFGGRAWEATTLFQALGVRPALIARLDAWGQTYNAMAQLFHY